MDRIKELFEELYELGNSEDVMERCDGEAIIYQPPATEEELEECEKSLGIKIPDDYRSWLKLAKYVGIPSEFTYFFMPRVEAVYKNYLPDEYVIIGNSSSDGELVCFSKESGKYIFFADGEIIGEYEKFEGVIECAMEWLRYDVPIIDFSDEKLEKMLEMAEKLRNGEETN